MFLFILLSLIIINESVLANDLIVDSNLSKMVEAKNSADTSLTFSFNKVQKPNQTPKDTYHVFLALIFPPKKAIVFSLDWSGRRVIVEFVDQGSYSRHNFDVSNLKFSQEIETMLVSFLKNPTQLKLHVQCAFIGMINLREGFTNFKAMQVLRSSKIPISLDTSDDPRKVVNEEDCSKKLGFCPDGTFCGAAADCFLPFGSISYTCTCKVGTAGNGKMCGKDSDLDGYPDVNLTCLDPHCLQDNCPRIPNSGQENADGDNRGDACDDDSDGDQVNDYMKKGRLRRRDNCHLIKNSGQKDSDNDGIGDKCDNCKNKKNTDQINTDDDDKGDACDDDDDNDGVPDESDNCNSVKNDNQEDKDKDGTGDACDNCPDVPNKDQLDEDNDFVGNLCDQDYNNHANEMQTDLDRDGIQDNLDNCLDFPNADQLDSDNDGKGNDCDEDMDGDGVNNGKDNCPFYSNNDQADRDKNGVGDICEGNQDGDNAPDAVDVCINNRNVQVTDFRSYQMIAMRPVTHNPDPEWEFFNEGAEVEQNVNSDASIAVGMNRFSGVDYHGTLFVADTKDDDYVGFVFSFQSNRKFYVMMWRQDIKKVYHKDPKTVNKDVGGTQIKLVYSATGPGTAVAEALLKKENTTNQATILWADPNDVEWKPYVSYRYQLVHRPRIGLIRLIIYEGTKKIIDSKNIFDHTLKGGRLGFYCDSQKYIKWSQISYRCTEKMPMFIYKDLPKELKDKVEIEP